MARKPRKGDFIEITARKVSEKIQPLIIVGGIYHINSVERLKNGATCLVLDKNLKQGTTIRCNEERFSWNVLTPQEVQEKQFKEQCRKDTEEMMKHFSVEEHARIGFTPLVIAEFAWHYADKVLRYCADHRIEEVKKLGRAVKHLRTVYEDTLKKDLDWTHRRKIENAAKEFIAEYPTDFTIMYCAVANEINHQHIQIPDSEMRTYAKIAIELCRLTRRHEDKMTELIRSKLGKASEGHLPCLSELETCMDAYLGNFEIKEAARISDCITVFYRKILNIELTIINN